VFDWNGELARQSTVPPHWLIYVSVLGKSSMWAEFVQLLSSEKSPPSPSRESTALLETLTANAKMPSIVDPKVL